MRRLLLLMIAAVASSGCQRSQLSDALTRDPTCRQPGTALQPALRPQVQFISDTSAAVLAWRESVGMPDVDRVARACEDTPIDSLLVISWNVHLGHAQIARFVSDLRSGRVVPGVPVRHFVILVQEAFRESTAVPAGRVTRGCAPRMGGKGADITAVADSLGLAVFYVPSMRNGCDERIQQDRGNAILSTLPLANLKAVELPLVRQRRVAALAEVKGRTTLGNEWTLELASVHFENRGRGGPRAWVHGRARQARALVEALPDSVLLAVGGDFNTLEGINEPAVRIVGAKFAHSPEHQTSKTFVSYVVVRSQLDYLFFRCYGRHRSTYWRARDRYGSDHFPIMGFVRVGNVAADHG